MKELFRKKPFLLLSIFLLLLIILAEVVFIFYPKNKEREEFKNDYRIGLILDIHSQRSKKNDYDISDSLKIFFKEVSREFNGEFNPDVVVQNGDFIEGTEREGWQSVEDFLKAKEYIDKIKAPVLHVVGNHEARGFSKEDWLKASGRKKTYYKFDLGDMRIIVLDGNEETERSREIGGNYYYMSGEQLKWLEKTLSESDNFSYKLVFVHFPVLESQTVPTDKNINQEDMEKLMRLFEKYRVEAVFSGHAEILRFDEFNGVRYFILPGVEKSKRRKVQWYGCFYEIYASEEIKVKMFYKKDPNQNKYETLIIPSEEFNRIEK